jgi:hypothetical protein
MRAQDSRKNIIMKKNKYRNILPFIYHFLINIWKSHSAKKKLKKKTYYVFCRFHLENASLCTWHEFNVWAFIFPSTTMLGLLLLKSLFLFVNNMSLQSFFLCHTHSLLSHVCINFQLNFKVTGSEQEKCPCIIIIINIIIILHFRSRPNFPRTKIVRKMLKISPLCEIQIYFSLQKL